VKLLRHRTVVFVLVVAALAAGWQAFIALTVPSRLSPEVVAALAQAPRVNVAVRLGFAPEEFHIRLFQGHGVVRGVQGTTVLLDRVPAADVERIARYYWVRGITLRS
jgi:hypothetical protein